MHGAGRKITMLPYGRTWNCRIARRRESERRRWEKREKTKMEPVRNEMRKRKRDRKYDPTLRNMCVAWVETAPRSPTGRIIIPTLAHVRIHGVEHAERGLI